MKKNNIKIYDTFAEAFPMKATRLIVTANSKKWAIEIEALHSFIPNSIEKGITIEPMWK